MGAWDPVIATLIILGSVTLLGTIVLVSYAVWLYHKASDLMAEIAVLGERFEVIGSLIEQIEEVDFEKFSKSSSEPDEE